MSDSLQPHGLQHARLPCPSPCPRACSNSYQLSLWCQYLGCQNKWTQCTIWSPCYSSYTSGTHHENNCLFTPRASFVLDTVLRVFSLHAVISQGWSRSLTSTLAPFLLLCTYYLDPEDWNISLFSTLDPVQLKVQISLVKSQALNGGLWVVSLITWHAEVLSWVLARPQNATGSSPSSAAAGTLALHSTICGNVHECSHYGKQYRGSSKN